MLLFIVFRIAFKLLLRPTRRRHGSWKTNGVHALNDRLLNFAHRGPRLRRLANMGTQSGFESPTEANADFHKFCGFLVETAIGINSMKPKCLPRWDGRKR